MWVFGLFSTNTYIGIYVYIYARYELIQINGHAVIYVYFFKRQYYNKLQKFSSTSRPADTTT